jgi:hypothetical protein
MSAQVPSANFYAAGSSGDLLLTDASLPACDSPAYASDAPGKAGQAGVPWRHALH